MDHRYQCSLYDLFQRTYNKLTLQINYLSYYFTCVVLILLFSISFQVFITLSYRAFK